MQDKPKEFLYVGYYISTQDECLLKIGTTNDLKRRKAEHELHYKRSLEHRMKKDGSFIYLWHLPLSKYNTLRYEDRNRTAWINSNVGEYIRNDRFLLNTVPTEVEVKIRKVYRIPLTNIKRSS